MNGKIFLKNWRIGNRERSSSARYNTIFSQINNTFSVIWNDITSIVSRIRNTSDCNGIDLTAAGTYLSSSNGLGTIVSGAISSYNSNNDEKLYFWTPMDPYTGTNIYYNEAGGYVTLSGSKTSHVTTNTDDYGQTVPASAITISIDGADLPKDHNAYRMLTGSSNSTGVPWMKKYTSGNTTTKRIKVSLGNTSGRKLNYITFTPVPAYGSNITIGYMNGNDPIQLASTTSHGTIYLTFAPVTYNGEIYIDFTPNSVSSNTYIGGRYLDFGFTTYQNSGTISIPLSFSIDKIKSFLVYNDSGLMTTISSSRLSCQIKKSDDSVVYSSSTVWPLTRSAGSAGIYEFNDTEGSIELTLTNDGTRPPRIHGISISYTE